MVKFEEPSDDVIEVFEKVKKSKSIPDWVQFEVLSNNKMKQVYKIMKMSDLVETLSKGVNFAVVINEEIFDGLTDEQQEMLMDECIAGVSISETDTIQLDKPDICTYTGILQKYGHDPIITLHESVKSLFDKKKEEDDMMKAERKSKSR